MANTLDDLENKLGHDLYRELFPLILTDRGVEFEKVDLFELNQETGEFRTNIFYCDAYQSSQKPHIENTHNYIRDIIPNEIDISNITQDDLDLMFSHINSTPRKSLKDNPQVITGLTGIANKIRAINTNQTDRMYIPRTRTDLKVIKQQGLEARHDRFGKLIITESK